MSDGLLSFDQPAGGPAPRGTVIVVPGRGESPEVYTRFGTRLTVDAYRVRVVGDPTANPDGVATEIAAALAAAAVAPVVLAGSDTGALFAAALVAGGEIAPDALLLAGLPVPAVAAENGHSANGHSANGAAANGHAEHGHAEAPSFEQELDARTTCPTHRGRLSDALIRPGALYEPVPDGWLQRAQLAEIRIPVLALHGREDPIAALDQVSDALADTPTAELIAVADARHDVLNNASHRTVAATVVLWLERLRTDDPAAPITVVERIGADVA